MHGINKTQQKYAKLDDRPTKCNGYGGSTQTLDVHINVNKILTKKEAVQT